MEIKEETKKKGDKEKGRGQRQKERKRDRGKVKHNNREILKTNETQKKIEKIRDRDRSAKRKKD